MPAAKTPKTVVQCDFDGTITEGDVGLALLDTFADGDWRRLFAQYQQGRIPVGQFNTDAFAMVKEGRPALLRFIRQKARVRAGFRELIDYCRRKGFRFVIVSNGLDFYIKAILAEIDLNDVEVFAAQTRFTGDGIDTRYIGPRGDLLLDGFKEAYSRLFLKNGCRLIYAGNGPSDVPAAKLADHIFATGPLLEHCRKTNLDCIPFADMGDIVKGLELLG